MRAPPNLPAWLPAALFAAGVAVFYWEALQLGFLNDDHMFLEQARRTGLWESLTRPDALANYFRPLSRQVWFEIGTAFAGGTSWAFHAASLTLLLTAAALTFDLLRATAGPAGAWLGTLYLVLLPLQRVNVSWISCSQDLLALVGALASMALFRRGHDRLALLACTLAVLSKESALPLPLLLGVWAWRIERQSPWLVARRLAPFTLPLTLWLLGTLLVLRGAPLSAIREGLSPAGLAATFAHLLQSLTAIEFPDLLVRSLPTLAPSLTAIAALVLLAAATLLRSADAAVEPVVPARRAAAFALAWLTLFSLPVWPLVAMWSSYFYTLAAVGGAMLIALAARNASRTATLATTAAMFVLHLAVSAIPAFATADDPWNAGSRMNAYYLERGSALSAQMASALRRAVPSPEPHTRFFFATLPPWAGFQMGNGAAVRALYGDPTLESWFYSQYGESTAAHHPSAFLFWNGIDLERLYERTADPLFEVGTDLLLLDRPGGAIHAFRRGMAKGESRIDHLYWLGWAYLWHGQRSAAEQAWTALGARDDSAAHVFALRSARTALEEGDTLSARRALVDAIRSGIGRPVPHAELGAILAPLHSKYGLLETLVASRLDPSDWLARRDLIEGLIAARLDDIALLQMRELRARHPAFDSDTVAVRLDSLLQARSGGGSRLAIPPRPRRLRAAAS